MVQLVQHWQAFRSSPGSVSTNAPGSFTTLQNTEAVGLFGVAPHKSGESLAQQERIVLRQQRQGMSFPVSQKEVVLFIAAADLHGNNTQSHEADI